MNNITDASYCYRKFMRVRFDYSIRIETERDHNDGERV